MNWACVLRSISFSLLSAKAYSGPLEEISMTDSMSSVSGCHDKSACKYLKHPQVDIILISKLSFVLPGKVEIGIQQLIQRVLK